MSHPFEDWLIAYFGTLFGKFRFIDQLFHHEEFIQLRKAYKRIYGHYPVEFIKKYASTVAEFESNIDDLSRSEKRELTDDFDAEIKAIRRDYKRRDKIIVKLIEWFKTQMIHILLYISL